MKAELKLQNRLKEARCEKGLSLILREILSGSMAVILPKIAPKPYTKTGGSAICRE